jgi:hypothetical protein
MLINISSYLRRIAVVVFAVAVVSIYVLYSYRTYAASSFARTGNYESVQRAIRLQPDNARYWHLAGAYSLYASQQPDRAIQQLTTSTRLNPWSSEAWLTLAGAYQVNGNEQKEKWAVDSAVNADPKTPDVAWEAANFYLVEGDIENSARLFRAVVENDASRSDLAFRILWRARPDVNFLLNTATPPSAAGHFALLNVLCSNQQPEAASAVWERIRTLPEHFPPELAYPFVDFLINSHLPVEAAQVWEQLADLDPTLVAHHGNNLILNGGFEDKISNDGFGWRYSPKSGAQVFVDSVVANSGTRSLAIEFDGWVAEAGIQQFVPVAPGGHYQFSGSMKSDDIQSSSGPRFGIYDAYDGTQYALSDDMLETNVWRRQNISFAVGPNTHLLVLKVVREPGNTRILGKVWIDDLRIVKE